MKTWIWSDLHLGHSNILKYTNRPFSDVEEMNKILLENWRATVSSADTLINLGDVSLGYSKEELAKIITNLPGRKVLILGNHDRGHSINWWQEVGFSEVYKYPIILDEFYILSHEPVFVNDHMPYMNIHGHIHDRNYEQKYYVNVSVEQIDYKPILFESLKS